jgi:hypothetical protein
MQDKKPRPRVAGSPRPRPGADPAADPAAAEGEPAGAPELPVPPEPAKPAEPAEPAKPAGPPEPPEPARKKVSRKLLVGLGVLVGAILAAVGTNLGNWISSPITTSDRADSSSSSSSSSASASAHSALSSKALPFAVDVAEDYGDCGAFALPAELPPGQAYAQLATADSYTDAQWGQFLLPLKGAPVDAVSIALTFSGVPGIAARIFDIEIKQLGEPANADSGAYIPVPHQGGGDDPYNFAVDLGDPNPRLEGVAGQQNFPGWQINVDQGLDSTVDIQFSAGPHAYTWDFVVDYDENGVSKSTEVTEPGGGPFTLTGSSARYGEVFQYDGGGYQPAGTNTSGD